MEKYLLIFILFFCIPIAQYAQIHSDDTLKNNSIDFYEDSLEYKMIRDTLNRIMNIQDTIDNLIVENNFQESDSVFELSYEEFMAALKDSLIFEQADSIFYVAYKLKRLIDTNTHFIDDSTTRAVRKLIYLSENRNVDKAMAYLKNKLNQSKDTSQVSLSDQLNGALFYLINSIPEDSVILSFTNSKNDSILFKSKESEIDSVYIKLYDHRGEFIVMWIKKTDTNVFEFFVEDGVYLEKAKKQSRVVRKVGSNIILPDLKEVKAVNMILPIWKLDGLADIKFNQGYLENWAEGGESSMSALSIVKFSADYTYGKKRDLDTDIEYRLGYLKSGEKSLQKNDDKFELNAKYGKSAFNNWYYSALFNFKTQFFKGYNYPNDSVPVSGFLSPAYLVFSVGMDFKPSNKFTFFISPLTAKYSIVSDTANIDQTRYGIASDQKIRKEIGAYIKAVSKVKINENVVLENKISFFTNYTDNPQNIDVDWEADLKVKLTEYIWMSINAHLIYDDDVDFPVKDSEGKQIGITQKLQFKELFGIGFRYSF